MGKVKVGKGCLDGCAGCLIYIIIAAVLLLITFVFSTIAGGILIGLFIIVLILKLLGIIKI